MKANAQTQVSGDLPMLWQASSTSEVKRVDTSVGGEGKALSRVYSHTKAAHHGPLIDRKKLASIFEQGTGHMPSLWAANDIKTSIHCPYPPTPIAQVWDMTAKSQLNWSCCTSQPRSSSTPDSKMKSMYVLIRGRVGNPSSRHTHMLMPKPATGTTK